MYEYISSNINNLKIYKYLFTKNFRSNGKFSDEYINWLYFQNSEKSGGVDIYYKNEIIGHVGYIIGEYILQNKVQKGALIINICVEAKHQGKNLFKKLILQLIEILKIKDVNFLYGFSNNKSTLLWKRKIGAQLVGELDFYFTKRSLKLNKQNNHFSKIWSKNELDWRLKSPNLKKIYTKFFISQHFNNKFILNNFYVGLNDHQKYKYFSINLKKFKPSPLVFIFKHFYEDIKLFKKEVIVDILETDII